MHNRRSQPTVIPDTLRRFLDNSPVNLAPSNQEADYAPNSAPLHAPLLHPRLHHAAAPDPHVHVMALLEKVTLIDGHNDVPGLCRV